MNKEKFKIALTGHRPQKTGGFDNNNPIALAIKAEITKILMDYVDMYSIHNIECISGFALGSDQYLCEVCLKMNIPYYAYIPHIGQESVWPKTSQDYYNYLLSKAKEVKIISEGTYTPKKMQIRNIAMADDCNAAIAVWNGSAGGTANCVNYLRQIKRPITYIDPSKYYHLKDH